MLLKSIGETIRNRRKELGITQPVLAELADVSKNTIYKLERGNGNPSIKTLNQLLEVLGLVISVGVKQN